MESLSKVKAKFIRGGTSKGVYIDTADLSISNFERDEILLSIMGSPDPTGIQLDGMGGGISSTSKIVLVSKIERNGIPFLNYNFDQRKKNRLVWKLWESGLRTFYFCKL